MPQSELHKSESPPSSIEMEKPTAANNSISQVEEAEQEQVEQANDANDEDIAMADIDSADSAADTPIDTPPDNPILAQTVKVDSPEPEEKEKRKQAPEVKLEDLFAGVDSDEEFPSSREPLKGEALSSPGIPSSPE
jgi:hypothetical protein